MLSRKQKQSWRRLEWRLYCKHFGSFWVNVSMSSQKNIRPSTLSCLFCRRPNGTGGCGYSRTCEVFLLFLLIIDQFHHFCCYHHLQDEYSMFSSEYVEVVLLCLIREVWLDSVCLLKPKLEYASIVFYIVFQPPALLSASHSTCFV